MRKKRFGHVQGNHPIFEHEVCYVRRGGEVIHFSHDCQRILRGLSYTTMRPPQPDRDRSYRVCPDCYEHGMLKLGRTLVLHRSGDRWALWAPGTTDAQIANGEGRHLLGGLGDPTPSDYDKALRTLRCLREREMHSNPAQRRLFWPHDATL